MHPLLGPRRWSPGRVGPKAEGTYPVSCRPGGWSAAWVRGYRGGGARGGLNGECQGPSPQAPRWAPDVRKHCRKKEPPLRTVDEGLYWAVALWQNSQGRVSEETKGVCEGRGMRGGERFYSQGRRPSQVFPYKEESAGYSGGWCPRAPCRYLIGPGCRGSVPGSLTSLWNLSEAFFRGIPQHA